MVAGYVNCVLENPKFQGKTHSLSLKTHISDVTLRYVTCRPVSPAAAAESRAISAKARAVKAEAATAAADVAAKATAAAADEAGIRARTEAKEGEEGRRRAEVEVARRAREDASRVREEAEVAVEEGRSRVSKEVIIALARVWWAGVGFGRGGGGAERGVVGCWRGAFCRVV